MTTIVDNLQAGQQTGAGPKLASDEDTNLFNWPISKLAFGAFNVDYTIVADTDGARLPVKTSPLGVSVTSHSGTITVGGTSQIVIAQDAARKGGFILNPVAALETLWLNFGTPATESDAVSFPLFPGDKFDFNQGGVVITDSINVIAATTGHAFQCKTYA